MSKKKQSMQDNLILGEKEQKKKLYLEEKNRMKNLVVVGTLGTGKSSLILPSLVEQDIKDKRVGATIMTGDKETAMVLYALAKRAGREVQIVKPSLTDTGKLLLDKDSYCYQEVKEEILDFEKAIRRKQIIIIDMEFAVHHEKSIKAGAILLSSLAEAMAIQNVGNVTNHFLYVDDAYLYMPYLKTILRHGKEYGIGTVLFLDSRLHLKEEELALLDSTVRSTVLTSGLTLFDAEYYARDIYEKQIPYIRNRPLNEFIYAIIDSDGKRIAGGAGKFIFLPDELYDSLKLSIPRYSNGIKGSQESSKQKPKRPLEPLKHRKPVENELPVMEEESSRSAEQVVLSEPSKEVKKETSITIPETPKPANKRDRVTKTVQKQMKRHVVLIGDVFGDDDEY